MSFKEKYIYVETQQKEQCLIKISKINVISFIAKPEPPPQYQLSNGGIMGNIAISVGGGILGRSSNYNDDMYISEKPCLKLFIKNKTLILTTSSSVELNEKLDLGFNQFKTLVLE